MTVVVAGYAIELNEQYFGAGNPQAPGAQADAVFTFWHQDFAFFMIPAIILVLVIAERYLPRSQDRNLLGRGLIAGTTLAFLGGLLYVFVDPHLYGIGFYVAATGFLGIAYMVARTWWALLTQPDQPTNIVAKPVATDGPTRGVGG